jgi:hypothetical protein
MRLESGSAQRSPQIAAIREIDRPNEMHEFAFKENGDIVKVDA